MTKSVVIASLVCTAAACATVDGPPITAAQLCARKDSVVAEIGGLTIDDDFEVLARLLPGGFGGLTTSSMFLKYPHLANAARKSAAMLAKCAGAGPAYLLSYVEFVEVRQGQYDWVELRRWYRQLLRDGGGGWNTADMDEGINRLTFAFATDAALQTFRSRAVALGVPLAALALVIRPPPVLAVASAPRG